MNQGTVIRADTLELAYRCDPPSGCDYSTPGAGRG